MQVVLNQIIQVVGGYIPSLVGALASPASGPSRCGLRAQPADNDEPANDEETLPLISLIPLGKRRWTPMNGNGVSGFRGRVSGHRTPDRSAFIYGYDDVHDHDGGRLTADRSRHSRTRR